MTTYNHLWLLTTTYNHLHPFMITYKHLDPLMTTYDHLQPLMTSYDHLQPLTTTYDHLWPLTTTYNHLQPLTTCLPFTHFARTNSPRLRTHHSVCIATLGPEERPTLSQSDEGWAEEWLYFQSPSQPANRLSYNIFKVEYLSNYWSDLPQY